MVRAMSRRGLGRAARFFFPLSLAASIFAIGCTTPPPPMLPDVYAPWADAGMDAGRPDAPFFIDAWLDPSLDAFRPIRPDAGMTDRDCMAEEVCGNGIDDDCTGDVDDGCACEAGTTTSCFRGDPMHRRLGVCADGTMACEGTEFGRWTTCAGDVLETAEVCDEAALDEDCDGVSNEGCGCSGDGDLPCGSDVGECVAGVQRCVDGMRTDCEGATGPIAEVCNDDDDDCDGMVDEGLTRRCGVDRGICIAGTESCVDGAFGMCDGAVLPRVDVCNGLDDDCDGMTDESLSRSCGTNTGACMTGTEMCTDGRYTTCLGSISPIDELCNGEDEDCDGRTDEALMRGCGTDVGECVAGVETCGSGAWGTCAGATMPVMERCEGSRDENCNGAVDEGCACTIGANRACGTDTGRCVAGSQICDGSGMWGMCMGATDPRTETCDGTDDDCDGMQDEGCDCVTGMTRACGTDTGECTRGTETCDGSGRWGLCAGSIGPSSEICNGRDDNCNGLTDEGDVCPRFPPVVMCPGPLTGLVGSPVTLNGTGSDPDGGTVVLDWTVSSRPVGSSNNPTPPGSGTATFFPDAAGAFTMRMCATDDEAATACCTTSLTVTSPCTPPTAPSLAPTCAVSWDRRPIIEFAPMPAGVQYEFFLDAASSPYGTVTMAGQNYFRPASAIAPGGPPPGTSHSITVRACRTSDLTCCATASAPASVTMIESCTTPVAASAANVIFSEYIIDGGPAAEERGEAIEITNLSNCPVTLNGTHFEYCNGTCASTAYRWMDFTPVDVIPPRGVYVALREAGICSPALGSDDPSLFGLRVSALMMQGTNIASGGWFNNSGGPMSQLRLAAGAWSGTIGGGATIDAIAPYLTTAPACGSIGYDAVNACGDVTAGGNPGTILTTHQLGRLWRPCDAVVSPVPACL